MTPCACGTSIFDAGWSGAYPRAPERLDPSPVVKHVACPRGRGANRRRSAVRPDSLYGRLVPGTTCGGVRSAYLFANPINLAACPIAPPRCLKRVRLLHAGRVSPIPSLAGRPRRRGPYSTIAICISQGSLTCEVALASSHKASQSPLTLMQGRIPQLHCRSLDMHPEPRINLRSQHNVGASEHFTWPNGRHHEGEHRPRGPS